MKKIISSLIFKLLVAMISGVLLGFFCPEPINRFVITLSFIFGIFLKFIIPMMIIAFVTMGIGNLNNKAGKLLSFTVIFSYISTIIMGITAFFIAINIFPIFTNSLLINNISNPKSEELKPLFEFSVPPIINVTSAIILAFMFGICISNFKKKRKYALYNIFSEFSEIIAIILKKIIIPWLPLFVCGIFINIVASKNFFIIINMFWKIFLVVIAIDTIFLFVIFTISGLIAKKNPFVMMKNQIPGYFSALGTQSSAAAIPINLECAKKNGVSEEIRNFVIPLCANIHMPGSIITIVCCTTNILLIYKMSINLGSIMALITTLAVVMMAAPGTPGGAIISALPFLTIVGISSDSTLAGILVALHIAQDSFGTACNVSGDNAIAIIVDEINKKFICKSIDTNDKTL